MKIKKQYARRSLIGFKVLDADPFQYKSLRDIGEDEFILALEQINQNLISRDIDGMDSKKEFLILKEFAGSAFEPKTWEVAYLQDKIVGVVCAQNYHDRPKQGSIFHVGVVPKFRKNGYGKILHARGLQQLVALGATDYVGSTDIMNQTMINVFLSNGCTLTQIIEVDL